jgi:hypothetical protein
MRYKGESVISINHKSYYPTAQISSLTGICITLLLLSFHFCEKHNTCEISGSQSSDCEEYCSLGCDIILRCRGLPTFWGKQAEVCNSCSDLSTRLG